MTTTDIGALPVMTFAAEQVARIAGDADLWQIADALVGADVGALVVGDAAAVTGIVSERDVVRALAARRDPARTTAGDIAATHIVWCDVESTVAEVAEEMMEQYVRHVLIEDDGRLAGVVSARDLLGAYVAGETPFED